ncbi:MAG: alanine racemase [Oscillospiraceae bacterium]|nr:alanine racemase [Oscillospiraceae bacterium]
MFLNKLKENNPALLRYAFQAHRRGDILPDTYLLDLDAIEENGRQMVAAAKENGVVLYFMLKQIGRNPLVAKKLMEIGFQGCVAVDFREALRMVEEGVHLGNVGHLVQVPCHALKTILAAKPDVVTVYTREKIREIDRVAGELGLIQPLLLRITDDDAHLYSGQTGGFCSRELPELLDLIETLPHVKVGGFTTFPALLYEEEAKDIVPTPNVKGLDRAVALARERGLGDLIINIPSATCVHSIPLIRSLGGNNGEPGHGLTGTTPLHKDTCQPEKVGYVYVSEVSHNFGSHAYCYGGGHYRRGHMENALVGVSPEECRSMRVTPPDEDSIDYYYELEENCAVSDTVILCHRTQIFTVRSEVVVVKGLGTGEPVIAGRYSSLGRELEKEWQE